jgi:hypothetical protein
MGRSQRVTSVFCVAGLLLIAACGSDGTSEESDAGQPDEATIDVESSTPAVDEAAVDEPEVTAAPDTVATVNSLTDFGDVCRGVLLAGATPYDPARSGVHPLVTMAGESPTYETAGALLPDQWDPVIGEEQTVELVACLDRTSSTPMQTCDGYTDDNDQDTGLTVEMYDASYDVRLIAAASGDEVATTQLDATDDVCPMFVFFDDGETVKPVYAEPTDALTEFLAPFVQT